MLEVSEGMLQEHTVHTAVGLGKHAVYKVISGVFPPTADIF